MIEFVDFFQKAGLSGGVLIVVAFIIVVFRFNVFTIFFASDIELKLLTKEQRTVNKVLTFVVGLLVTGLFNSLFIILLAQLRFYFTLEIGQIISSVFLLLLCLHLLFILMIFNSKRFKEKDWVIKLHGIIFFVCYPYSIFTLTPIFAGFMNAKNLLTILLLLFFSSLFFSAINYIHYLVIIKFLMSAKALYIELPNTDPNSNTIMNKWYIINPIHQEFYLLANEPNIKEAKQVIQIQKAELFEHVINIETRQ